jgi:uncharacterized protein YegJ (DUF2314 family)
MAWNKISSKCTGAVFFRGAIAPLAREFADLRTMKISSVPDTAREHELWALRLSHPKWGAARLSSKRRAGPIPKPILQFDARLGDAEKADASLGKSAVLIELDGDKGDVLRDRKRLLRFLNAAMGSDGLISLDMTAMRFWSRAALVDELCHDADLDIDSLFTIHAIHRGDNKPYWCHTHGLAEIGFFDFDILNPSPDLLTSRCHDFARAMAFSIVEDKVKASTPLATISSAGPIRLVDVDEFNRRASRNDRALRDDDEIHNRNRTILCEPVKPRWTHKFLPPPPVPSRLLSGPQGEFMVYFPSAATRLMERRARQTYEMFRRLSVEFADLKSKPIVKLGYPINSGNPDEKEHMWFEVHALHDDGIDATLVNQPRNIRSLQQGDRRVHSLDRLTDWMLIGATGTINPRDTRPARVARQNREKILQLLDKQK